MKAASCLTYGSSGGAASLVTGEPALSSERVYLRTHFVLLYVYHHSGHIAIGCSGLIRRRGSAAFRSSE